MISIKFRKFDLFLKIGLLALLVAFLLRVIGLSILNFEFVHLVTIAIVSALLFFGWMGVAFETINITFHKDSFAFERVFSFPSRKFIKKAHFRVNEIDHITIKHTTGSRFYDQILVDLMDGQRIKLFVHKWNNLNKKNTLEILKNLDYKVQSVLD